jgi:biotin transporter BioY
VKISDKARERFLNFWLVFALARMVFFSAHWAYMEMVVKIDEPPITVGLSYMAMIESAMAAAFAIIAAKK